MPSVRVLPELTPENAFFWTGGAAGELRILRCGACRTWIHPPSPICPSCRSRELAPEAASGRGTLLTWTVNHHRWGALPVPYVIAIVELDEQPGLRLLTNLVDVPEGRLRIGLRVAVRFEPVEDVWLPLFAPEPT
jgi:uncharacterized OB-fold protein